MRKLTVVGRDKMAARRHEQKRKLTVHDRVIRAAPRKRVAGETGDIHIPRVASQSPCASSARTSSRFSRATGIVLRPRGKASGDQNASSSCSHRSTGLQRLSVAETAVVYPGTPPEKVA